VCRGLSALYRDFSLNQKKTPHLLTQASVHGWDRPQGGGPPGGFFLVGPCRYRKSPAKGQGFAIDQAEKTLPPSAVWQLSSNRGCEPQQRERSLRSGCHGPEYGPSAMASETRFHGGDDLVCHPRWLQGQAHSPSVNKVSKRSAGDCSLWTVDPESKGIAAGKRPPAPWHLRLDVEDHQQTVWPRLTDLQRGHPASSRILSVGPRPNTSGCLPHEYAPVRSLPATRFRCFALAANTLACAQLRAAAAANKPIVLKFIIYLGPPRRPITSTSLQSPWAALREALCQKVTCIFFRQQAGITQTGDTRIPCDWQGIRQRTRTNHAPKQPPFCQIWAWSFLESVAFGGHAGGL